MIADNLLGFFMDAGPLPGSGVGSTDIVRPYRLRRRLGFTASRWRPPECGLAVRHQVPTRWSANDRRHRRRCAGDSFVIRCRGWRRTADHVLFKHVTMTQVKWGCRVAAPIPGRAGGIDGRIPSWIDYRLGHGTAGLPVAQGALRDYSTGSPR